MMSSGVCRQVTRMSGSISEIQRDELRWTSASIRAVLCPRSLSHIARCTARVLFPTPPLEFVKAIS